jgi:hypothetical protein
MRNILFALAASCLLLPLAACGADDDASSAQPSRAIDECLPDTASSPDFDHVVITEPPLAPPTEAGGGGPADPEAPPVLDTSEHPSGACACADDACVIDWIERNVGCGACVDFQCADGGGFSACVPCSENSNPDPCISPEPVGNDL